MRKTKLVALLLVVALVASMVVPGVSAADPYEVTITDQSGNSTATVEAGQTIMLQVNMSGNPGISSVAMKMAYPEGWTFAAQNKKLFNDKAEASYTSSKNFTDNPYTLMWTMQFGTTPDPFGGDAAVYEATCEAIDRAVRQAAEGLAEG